MAFAGISKPNERADVIAYLHSLNPNAPALPTAEAAPAPEAPATPDQSAPDPNATIEQTPAPAAPAQGG
jgi:cytochrome c